MIPPSFRTPGFLTWSNSALSRGCDLKRNDEILGTLRHLAPFSLNYLAQTQYGKWIFSRDGFLGASAQIRDSTSQQRIASFRSVWAGGGTLTFADGLTFHLKCKGWAHPVWSITTESGQFVVSLHAWEKRLELRGGFELPEDQLALLIMFTLYRMRQAEEDAASAAMVG